MILTACKLSGLPIAVAPMFEQSKLVANHIHPIFALSVDKLRSLAEERKTKHMSGEEILLLSMAFLNSTGLLKSRRRPFLAPETEGQKINCNSLLVVAKELAYAVELMRGRPQSAKNIELLPLYYVDEQSAVATLLNWARVARYKANAFIEHGREVKRTDAAYMLGFAMLDETSKSKAKTNRTVNADYQLPQVYDDEIGEWAFDKFDESLSDDMRYDLRKVMPEIHKFLTCASAKITPRVLDLLHENLSHMLPTDSPINARRTQLTAVFVAKAYSKVAADTAAMLGEKVVTAQREVAGVNVGYVMLDSGHNSVGAAAPSGMIAGAQVAKSRAAATRLAAKPQTLDTATRPATMPPQAATSNAPKLSADFLARARAKLNKVSQ